MKCRVCFDVLVMLLSCLFSAIAQEDILETKLPADFHPQQSGFEVLSDGRVLVCGDVGDPMDHRAAMYIFAADGNAVDVTPPKDRLEGVYRDAFFADENTLIALRSVPDEYTWRVARLEDGEIQWTTDKIENVFSLDRINDRFLVSCKPEPVTAEIRCLDFDGNEEWKIRLEERINIEGILTGDQMHIAYGSKLEDPIGDKDQRSASLVFAFDNAGNILWRHDGGELDYSTKCIDAVWAGGEAVVIGTGCICRYNKEGQLWEKKDAAKGMFGIVPIEGGYLIGCHGNDQEGMRFIRVNEDGGLTGDFDVKDMPGGTPKLLTISETPYLVFYDLFEAYTIKLVKVDIGKYMP